MNVPSLNIDVMKRADLVEIGVGDGSGDGECEEEAEGGQKQPPLGRHGDLGLKDFVDAGIAQGEKNQGCYDDNRQPDGQRSVQENSSGRA